MVKKLKSDIVKVDTHIIRVDYIKSIKGNGKTYVDVAFFGEYAIPFDNQTNKKFTSRFYASKEHAKSIVLPAIRSFLEKHKEGYTLKLKVDTHEYVWIYKYGPNDFSVWYTDDPTDELTGSASRGTSEQMYEEFIDNCKHPDFKEYIKHKGVVRKALELK